MVGRKAKVHAGSPAGVTTVAGVTLEPLNKARYAQGPALPSEITYLVIGNP